MLMVFSQNLSRIISELNDILTKEDSVVSAVLTFLSN